MARHLDHRFKLRQLRIANAIDSQGSITAASRLLGLSQPALTKSLHELESAVGLQLYVRHPRGVEPTAAGQAVIRSARHILAELRRLDEELDSLSAPGARRISVGTNSAAAASVLPHILVQLRQASPDMQVIVTEGDDETLLAALGAAVVDVVLGDLPPGGERDGLVREVVHEDHVVMVARADHPLFATDPTLAMIERYDLIVPPLGRPIGSRIQAMLPGLPHFSPRIVQSTSIGFAREMLRFTDAIVLGSRLMLSADVQQGNLRVVPIDLGLAPMPFGVTRRDDGAPSPTLDRFLDALRAAVSLLTCEQPPSSGETPGST